MKYWYHLGLPCNTSTGLRIFFFCKSHFLCLESFMNLEESRIPPFDLLPLRSIILTLHMVDLDTKNMIKSAKITEQFRDCLEH